MNRIAFPHRLISALHRLVGLLPGTLRLPMRTRVYRRSAHLEPEFERLHRLTPPGGLALDIGANHGYYTYRMLQHFDQVYAFEPNQAAGYDLFRYRHPRLRVYPYALSDRSGTAPLHVPLQRSNRMALWGWASLEVRSVDGAVGVRTVEATLRTLDEVVGGMQVALIKVDVEGHEVHTIRGAMGTIARDRPVLIVETEGMRREAVEALLLPLGYAAEPPVSSSPNVVYRCL